MSKFAQHKKWVVSIKMQELAGQNCAKKTLVVGWRWVRFILCLAIPEVLKEREKERSKAEGMFLLLPSKLLFV